MSAGGADWRPGATPARLQARAALLARTRAFFAARGVLEVDTPLLVNAPVSDVHIHSAAVQLAAERGASAQLFLQTSPEYAMKRLLAAGSGDIYQVCHVVRALEHGRLHNAEFTLIEWYRLGFTLEALMDEVAALVRELLGSAGAQRAPRASELPRSVHARAGTGPLYRNPRGARAGGGGARLRCASRRRGRRDAAR